MDKLITFIASFNSQHSAIVESIYNGLNIMIESEPSQRKRLIYGIWGIYRGFDRESTAVKLASYITHTTSELSIDDIEKLSMDQLFNAINYARSLKTRNVSHSTTKKIIPSKRLKTQLDGAYDWIEKDQKRLDNELQAELNNIY